MPSAPSKQPPSATTERLLRSFLVVDDHPIIATACGLVLEGIASILAAHDAVSGYQAFLEHKPDIVTVDLSLRGEAFAGLALIERIRSSDPGANVLVFSMHAGLNDFVSAMEAGAGGYLLKDAPPEELVNAVQQAGSGRRYIDPRLAIKLVFPRTTLSPKQKRVLAVLLEDTPYATIARNWAIGR
jgi:DNA-binding NarL/FixJ family response regulator